MGTPNKPDTIDRLVGAYEKMLERVQTGWDRAGHGVPSLGHALDQAREKAVELEELTREEADKIAEYLERDIKNAAAFLAEGETTLSSWLRFDLELIEERLRDLLVSVADKTRLELETLAEEAQFADLYCTGEISGPGTLVCQQCGQEMHFHAAGHIPPCPTCHATEFRRREAQLEETDTPDTES